MMTSIPFKLKDQKITCECGCGNTLYMGNLEGELITIGSEPNARRSFQHYQGVVIDRGKLFKMLNTEDSLDKQKR
jgi:hypothetical protein